MSVSLNALSFSVLFLCLELLVMCPQPLSTFRDSNLVIHLDALKERPELAAQIMRVISIWSMIDTMYPKLLCNFLESDLITTAALYNTVINSSLKIDMIAKAAEKALSNDLEGLELYISTQDSIKASRKCRNDFSHYIWCIAPKIKNSICLLNPTDLVNAGVSYEQHIVRRIEDVSIEDLLKIDQINNNKVMVYRTTDLETEVKNALRAHELMRLLLLCFHRTGNVVHKVRAKSRQKLADALKPPD